jgi:hypothetical protein
MDKSLIPSSKNCPARHHIQLYRQRDINIKWSTTLLSSWQKMGLAPTQLKGVGTFKEVSWWWKKHSLGFLPWQALLMPGPTQESQHFP